MPRSPICIFTNSSSRSSMVEPQIVEPQTDLFNAIWQSWEMLGGAGSAEQRDLAVMRMQACLEGKSGELDLSSLNLIELPTLPPQIHTLNCANNSLTELPSLPSTLREINCSNNKIGWLPPLPSQLIKLNCRRNQLTSLPTLPNSVSDINCAHNQLIELPPLPLSLIILRCCENALVTLPTLSHLKSFKIILCTNNCLKNMPTLGKNMVQLTCSNNQLTALPALPKNFLFLTCNNNQLQQLPPLPKTLSKLECSANQIKELPKLPKNITKIICNNNRLTTFPILQPQIVEFSFEGNPLDIPLERLYCQLPILKKTLAVWGIKDISHWETCIHENYCDAFIYFLNKLLKPSYLSSSLRKLISDWLIKLALPESKTLREETFHIAHLAGTTCHDRVYLNLNFMLLANLAFETKKSINTGRYDTTSKLQELLDVGQQVYRFGVLMTIANEKIITMAQQNKKYDDVEIYLSFQCQLRHSLNLPGFVSNMVYRPQNFVSNAELRYAMHEVTSRENTEFLPFLATQWAPWQCYIERCHKLEYDKAREEMTNNLLDDTLLDNKITQYLQLQGFPVNDEDARRQAGKEVATKTELEAMLPLTRAIIENLKKEQKQD